MTDNKIVVFQEKNVRRVLYNDEWYFSVIDIIEILTDTSNPRRYWSDLKRKLLKEGFDELYEKIVQLKLPAPDAKERSTDCTNTPTMLRLIQSIPSPKAEPFKRWLSQVGYERIQEIENPELGIERVRELYKAKGYPDEWIETRLKSIDIRKQLTDEWQLRGVNENTEYSILTSEISKATFGLTPSEYKDLKNLKRENLRDHMTNLELIFTMLGEEATRQIAVDNDAQGFNENFDAAQLGGKAAGNARDNFEKTSGKKVVSKQNFKHLKGKDFMNELNSDKEE